jgi:predicted amidohydrolase YtcJ
MRRPGSFLLALAALLQIGCLTPSPQPADLLLTGGRLYTANAEQPWAAALAVRGERIVAVGTDEEMEALAGEATRRIDLGGRVAIPGINDAHRHFYSLAPEVHQLPLTPLEPSWEETRRAIAQAAAELAAGAPIYGSVGVTVMTDPQVDRSVLDELAPENPVMLSAFYGHGLVLNSLALAALGIADDEPDPAGGFFERQADGRRVNGRVFEYAQWRPMRDLAARVPDEHLLGQLQHESAEMLRLGITSYLVMPLVPLEQYLRLLGESDLPQRVRVTRMPMTSVDGRNRGEDADAGVPQAIADRVTLAGTKWVLEGTPLERGVALREPYNDRPDWSGRLNFPPAEIEAILRESLDVDEPLLLHVSGDRTIETVFDAMESMAEVDWPARRVRLEHADGLTGDLLERAARLGVVVVQNPTHFGLPQFIMPRLGPDREFFRMRTLLEAGIAVAIGSDGPANPWLDVMLAVIHPTDPTEALSVAQAIDAYTRGAAWAEGQEEEKGILAAGMLADVAVLSQDIFNVPPEALPATKSVLTMIGGRIVHDTLVAQ